MPDLRTRAEHEAWVALITERVRAFTVDDGVALHLSPAGGRKAMTYPFPHQRKARIRAYLEETVGPLAETYAIQAIEEVRPDSYGLAIDPQRIEIMGEGYL